MLQKYDLRSDSREIYKPYLASQVMLYPSKALSPLELSFESRVAPLANLRISTFLPCSLGYDTDVLNVQMLKMERSQNRGNVLKTSQKIDLMLILNWL